MQQDGSYNEEKRKQRVERGIRQEKLEDAKDSALTIESKRGMDKEMKPEFLQKLGANVYMGGEETLEERMQRNKATRQRPIDDTSFL